MLNRRFWPASAAFVALLSGVQCLMGQSGIVHIVPKLAPNQPLTAEVYNTSKLSIQVSRATIRFAPVDDSPACLLHMNQPITIGPAGMEIVKLAEYQQVSDCLQRTRGQTARITAPYILTDTELNRPPVGRSVYQPAELQAMDVSIDVEISNRKSSTSTRWHLPIVKK
jgi:hypothetical protein